MLKKTITYKDLEGNDVVEDFYFNLSKAELAEMELSQEGGLSAYLQKIVKTKNSGEVILTFKKILLTAVGRRSEDGRRFVKTDEIRDDFLHSDAYSELFMELVTDSEKSAEFIKGIVPSGADISEETRKSIEKIWVEVEDEDEDKIKAPAWVQEDREPTKKELMEMPREQLIEAMKRKNAAQQAI